MASKPKVGGYKWHERLAAARALLAKHKRVPAQRLDGRIDDKEAIIAMATLGVLADEELEQLQRETGK